MKQIFTILIAMAYILMIAGGCSKNICPGANNGAKEPMNSEPDHKRKQKKLENYPFGSTIQEFPTFADGKKA